MRLLALPIALILASGCGGAGPAAPPPAAAPGSGDHAHHDHRGGMHRRFDDAAAWSKVFDAPDRDAWQRPDEVVGLLGLTEGAIVADVGAGTGYFVARLSRAVGPSGRVVALDLEPDMVRHMTERARREGLANVEARQVAADDPGLAPGSVDRILVVDTWHHIGDRAVYVPKLARALRPGGAVVVVDFTMEARRGPPVEHRVPPEQVVRELAAAGLEAAVVPEALPDQYVVRGTLRATP